MNPFYMISSQYPVFAETNLRVIGTKKQRNTGHSRKIDFAQTLSVSRPWKEVCGLDLNTISNQACTLLGCGYKK